MTVAVPIFKDRPDLSTPVDAAHLNGWGTAIKVNADAAEAAEAGATAPTDAIMAAKVADAASLTRAAGNGVWATVVSEPLNVLRYGAVGDGTTDDTAAFTSAITA